MICKTDLLSQDDDDDDFALTKCRRRKVNNWCSNLNQNNKFNSSISKNFLAIQNNTNFDSKSIDNFKIANFPSITYGLSDDIELIAKIDNTLNIAYQNESNFKYQNENQFLLGTSIYSNYIHNLSVNFNPNAIINNQFNTMIGNFQYRYNIIFPTKVISPYMNFIANRNENSIELINNYGFSYESFLPFDKSIFSFSFYGYSSPRYRNLMEMQIAFNFGLIELNGGSKSIDYLLDLGITLGTGLNSASRGYFGNISLSYYLDLR
jgi:hypothetical protein